MEAVGVGIGLLCFIVMALMGIREAKMKCVLRILALGPRTYEFLVIDCRIKDSMLIKLEEKGLIHWQHGCYFITPEGKKRI